MDCCFDLYLANLFKLKAFLNPVFRSGPDLIELLRHNVLLNNFLLSRIAGNQSQRVHLDWYFRLVTVSVSRNIVVPCYLLCLSSSMKLGPGLNVIDSLSAERILSSKASAKGAISNLQFKSCNVHYNIFIFILDLSA